LTGLYKSSEILFAHRYGSSVHPILHQDLKKSFHISIRPVLDREIISILNHFSNSLILDIRFCVRFQSLVSEYTVDATHNGILGMTNEVHREEEKYRDSTPLM